jgi:hypothetical protein
MWDAMPIPSAFRTDTPNRISSGTYDPDMVAFNVACEIVHLRVTLRYLESRSSVNPIFGLVAAPPNGPVCGLG